MGKEILTFGDTEIEKKLILLQYDSHFSKGCRYWESSFYAYVKRYNGQRGQGGSKKVPFPKTRNFFRVDFFYFLELGFKSSIS